VIDTGMILRVIGWMLTLYTPSISFSRKRKN
jgi:hypothetical protein